MWYNKLEVIRLTKKERSARFKKLNEVAKKLQATKHISRRQALKIAWKEVM